MWGDVECVVTGRRTSTTREDERKLIDGPSTEGWRDHNRGKDFWVRLDPDGNVYVNTQTSREREVVNLRVTTLLEIEKWTLRKRGTL